MYLCIYVCLIVLSKIIFLNHIIIYINTYRPYNMLKKNSSTVMFADEYMIHHTYTFKPEGNVCDMFLFGLRYFLIRVYYTIIIYSCFSKIFRYNSLFIQFYFFRSFSLQRVSYWHVSNFWPTNTNIILLWQHITTNSYYSHIRILRVLQ